MIYPCYSLITGKECNRTPILNQAKKTAREKLLKYFKSGRTILDELGESLTEEIIKNMKNSKAKLILIINNLL